MLVTFEGIDGSGKSTQIVLLQNKLKAFGFSTLSVREPGGTLLSEKVRSLLLDPAMHIVPFAELLLFSAARAQLVSEKIKPALARGTIVICDRFYDSTTAYQGAGRGVADLNWIISFNRRVTEDLVPDRTYWLDLPWDKAFERRTERPADRMETADSAFFDRVSEAYSELANREPERILRLDATMELELLHLQIWNDLKHRLGQSMQ